MRGTAYRRKKHIVKFKRRVNIWDTNIWDENNFKSIKASILKGESHRFLKTTFTACNCYHCSKINKYKRRSRELVQRSIISQIVD